MNVVLNRPPLSMVAPSARWMSQARPSVKASTLSPFTVQESPSSSIRATWSAWWARNTCPVPLTCISDMPSPVNAFLSIFATPPLPS